MIPERRGVELPPRPQIPAVRERILTLGIPAQLRKRGGIPEWFRQMPWELVGAVERPPTLLRLSEYARPIEAQVPGYLAQLLLVKGTYENVQRTDFQTGVWSPEELWHSIGLYLDHDLYRMAQINGGRLPQTLEDVQFESSRRTETARIRRERLVRERIKPYLFGGTSYVLPALGTVVDLGGVVHELQTEIIYGAGSQLAFNIGDIALGTFLATIAPQESSHRSEYGVDLKKRLRESSIARHVGAWYLNKGKAVGEGIVDFQLVASVIVDLFDNPEGRDQIKKMDGILHQYPGMEDTYNLQTLFDRAKRAVAAHDL